jgi:hypothetical protein
VVRGNNEVLLNNIPSTILGGEPRIGSPRLGIYSSVSLFLKEELLGLPIVVGTISGKIIFL